VCVCRERLHHIGGKDDCRAGWRRKGEAATCKDGNIIDDDDRDGMMTGRKESSVEGRTCVCHCVAVATVARDLIIINKNNIIITYSSFFFFTRTAVDCPRALCYSIRDSI